MTTDTEPTRAKRQKPPIAVVAATAAVAVQPDDLVTIDLAAAVFGLSRKAIELKIARGHWAEKRQYHRDPQGCLWISRKGVRAWVEGAR